MKPSELCALMEAAAGDDARCKSVFVTLGEYRLQTTTRNILPLLLQLWEASREAIPEDDRGDYPQHFQDALAALDQYGEGEK